MIRRKLREFWENYGYELEPRDRRYISVGIVALAMLLGFLLPAQPPQQMVEPSAESQKITLPVEPAFIKKQDGVMHKFELEIAKSPVDIEMGLMFRQSMKSDHGMMFQFGKRDHTSFWMKNTYLPLDILFIDADGTIVNIHRDAIPHSTVSIPSVKPVTGVIELNAGVVYRLGIAVGDKVIHPYFGGGEKQEAQK